MLFRCPAVAALCAAAIPTLDAKRIVERAPGEERAKGAPDLTWHREAGLGGNGRGCQMSEVRLIGK